MLVLSADHKIEDIEKFHKAIYTAKETALEKKLVTFGVKPTGPNTGYGYIKYSGDEKNLSKVANQHLRMFSAAKVLSTKKSISCHEMDQ